MTRIEKFASLLHEPCLIENPVDLLYLTGMSLSKGRLYVNRKQASLFVDGRYYERAKKEAPCAVFPWEEQNFAQEERIGFDSAFLSYDGYLALKKKFPHIEWIPLSNPLKMVRLYKEAQEIAALQRAADVTYRGYQKILTLLREGISEEEVALEFEIFCRKNGASGLSFEPIIAFGENSAYPHHRAGKTRLQNNQVVLIDIGAVVDLYHADMTRVFFFGTPDPAIVRLEQIVKTAHQKAIAHIKPGVRLGELDQIVRDEFDKHNVKPLYTHSLGHGVGLETHEYPRIKVDGEDKDLLLKQGMVFTIEPGLYQPGLGGIRIEDMVLVTETGHKIYA